MQLVKVWKDDQGNVNGWMAYDHHYCFASRDGIGATLESLLEAIEYSWITYLEGVSVDFSSGFFGGGGQVISLPEDHEDVLNVIIDLVMVAINVGQELDPVKFQGKESLGNSVIDALNEVKKDPIDPSEESVKEVTDLLTIFLEY